MSYQPIQNTENLYYGDETRWFIGIVEDVLDPLKLGRVKVRIVGVHAPDKSKIPTADLPWAMVMEPSDHSGTSGMWGTAVNLKPSAQVFGIFMDGRMSQSPLVLGSIPHIEQPPSGAGAGKHTGQSHANPPGTQPGQNPAQQQTPSVGVATPVVGNTSQEKAYNYLEQQFRNAGHPNSKEIAAGFVGNLMVESYDFREDVINGSTRGDGGTAYGVAQWRFDRADNLEAFARGQPNVTYYPEQGGRRMPDLETQVKFIWHELQTTEGRAYREIVKSTDAKDAARRIDKFYERSDGLHREQRATNAAAIYDNFTTKTVAQAGE